jgi:hypothetical protein
MEGPPALIVFGYFWNDLNDDYFFPATTVIEGWRTNTIESINYRTGEASYFPTAEMQRRFEAFRSWGDPDYERRGGWSRTKVWLRQRSILVNLYRRAKRRLRRVEPAHAQPIPERVTGRQARHQFFLAFMDGQAYPWLDTAWRRHLTHLSEFEAYTRSIGSELLIVIIPTKEQIYERLGNGQRVLHDRARSRLMNHLKGEGIGHLDLLPVFQSQANGERDLYWNLDSHWNPAGNHLAGLAVSQHILSRDYLAPRGKTVRLKEVMRILDSRF